MKKLCYEGTYTGMGDKTVAPRTKNSRACASYEEELLRIGKGEEEVFEELSEMLALAAID